MSDVFLSYAKDDRERVRPLVQLLEKHGWSVWWDRTIPPGKSWPQFIQEGLDSCRAMVVVWTEVSVESEWVAIETSEGKKRGFLVPVRLDEVDPPLAFSLIQAADLTEWDGSKKHPEFQAAISSLEKILGVPDPSTLPEPEDEHDDQLGGEGSTIEFPDKEFISLGRPEAGQPGIDVAKRQTALTEPRSSEGNNGHDVIGADQRELGTGAADLPDGGTAEQPRPTRGVWVKRGSLGLLGVVAVVVISKFLPSTPIPEPRIDTLQASLSSITQGDEVTLTWSTSEASRVELRPGGPLALYGSTVLSPTQTTDYVMVAFGPGGESQRSIRISVSAPAAVIPSANLTVEPSSIEAGASTTLSWTTANADTVRIEPGIGLVSSNGSFRVTPSEGLTYRLLATGPGGTRESRASVTVTARTDPPAGGQTESDLMDSGVEYYRAGDYSRAAQAFRGAADLNEYNRDARLYLAQTHFAAEQWTEVISSSLELINLDPLNGTVWMFVVRAYSELGQTERANGVFQEYQDLGIEIEDLLVDPVPTGGATVSGTLKNLSRTQGSAISLRFTFAGEDTQLFGVLDIEIQIPAVGERVEFRGSFLSSLAVTGYVYRY